MSVGIAKVHRCVWGYLILFEIFSPVYNILFRYFLVQLISIFENNVCIIYINILLTEQPA